MTYKNPENYFKILVRPYGSLPKENEEDVRTWAVAGVTHYAPIGMYNKMVGVVEYIQFGFKNEQVAKAWMDEYLRMYVKDRYFDEYVEGWLFEPLDESKTAR